MKKYLWGIRRRLICHIAACCFSVAVVIPLVLMLADRTPAFELSDGKTIPAVLSPGAAYQFDWKMTPKRSGNCEGTVFWEIVDAEGTIWTTPPLESLFANLRVNHAIRVVGRERKLPTGISKGRVAMRSWMEFRCNPVHNFWPIKVRFPIVYSEVR